MWCVYESEHVESMCESEYVLCESEYIGCDRIWRLDDEYMMYVDNDMIWHPPPIEYSWNQVNTLERIQDEQENWTGCES